MDKIRKQIEEICVFPTEKWNALKNARDLKFERIQHGIKMMKESGVFTADEIKEISEFACTKLDENYEEALERKRNYLRDNWRF